VPERYLVCARFELPPDERVVWELGIPGLPQLGAALFQSGSYFVATGLAFDACSRARQIRDAHRIGQAIFRLRGGFHQPK